MHNKKVLSKIDLGKYKKPNPYKDDIILSDEGQWKYPGSVTRIPSNEITMEDVPYMVWAQPNVGPGIMMEPGKNYYFDNADYVDEYPQIAKQGGSLKKNNTSRSIKATNKLFAQNYLFKKPGKKKIFDPNSKFYQEGGEFVEMDLDDAEIELFKQGGYIVEDISVPQLTQAQNGGGKYDPLVYNKPQVSESTKPNLVSKVDKKIIDKAIKQKTAERKIVTDKIKKDPLLTKKQKTEILMSPKKQDEYTYLAYEKSPDTVKQIAEYVPQSFSDKAKDILYNPFTAANFVAHGESVPDYMQRDLDRGTFAYYRNGDLHTERNPFDMVTDVTPTGAIHSTDNIITKATDNINNNFWTKNTALDVLNILPTAKLLKGVKFKNLYNSGVDYPIATTPRIHLNNTRALDLGSDMMNISKPKNIAVDAADNMFREYEIPTELPGSPNAYDNVQKAGFMNPLALADRVIPRPFAPTHYFGVEGSWNNVSPLNIIPGYGKKLSNTTGELPIGFRKFGNSLDDVVNTKTFKPKGGGRMGSKQIESEGNWAEEGKANEHYDGVFEATMNPNIEGSNIKLQKIRNRNGILGTTKEGDVAIPLTDAGLSFNRRLPFSNKYVPINKQKLLDNKFQLATQLPHVQSLIEKYGLIAGHAAVLGYISNGEKGVKENLKTINKYSVDPVINWSKKEWDSLKKAINKKEEGGLVNDYIDTELTPEEIEWYKSQGYDIEELD